MKVKFFINPVYFAKPFCMASALLMPVFAASAHGTAHHATEHHEHGAHVHGAAKLDVAIDGNTVTLMLESPMDSLAGFEHRASSDKDKATLKTLKEKLDDAGKLFMFTDAADCALQSGKIESPLFAEHGDTDEKHEHEEETHSDLDGEFVFRCAAPDKLRNLTVNLFDVAANLHDLDVSVAGPRGQKATELSGKSRTITF